MAENYRWYPDGGRDHTSPTRHDVKDLVREGSKWRLAGSEFTSKVSEEEMAEIRRSVESGVGRILKKDLNGHSIDNGDSLGKADLLKWTGDLEEGGAR